MFINDQQAPAYGNNAFIRARDQDALRFNLWLFGWPAPHDKQEAQDFCRMWAGA